MGPSAGCREWSLSAGGRQTSVRLGRGLLREGARVFGGSPVCVADARAERHVREAWSAAGGAPDRLFLLEGGEGIKTWEEAGRLCGRIVRAGIDRRTRLVAAGGGTIGDLAGFCAAVLLRGIPLVQIPTTLTAQIDSALGGKVALNLPEGKNLVGAFHPPESVWIDPTCLDTLDAAALRQGWAEILKAALLGDPELWALLESGSVDPHRPPSEEVMACVIEVKLRRVQADPFDTGVRRELNLGHTLGHALEGATRWELSHGDAVAIGIVFALELAQARGVLRDLTLSARARTLLATFGLPVVPPQADPAALEEILSRDKKGMGGRLTWILPVRPGEVAVVGGDPGRDREVLGRFLGRV
ncbi:MAG: 3-dehydroquinate synthase [Planctomycetes bacterium]|nr:3-dehydroquinate synthase [Planctomycetota bacterium]